MFLPGVVSKAEGPLAALTIGTTGGGTNWPGASYDPELHTVFAQAANAGIARSVWSSRLPGSPTSSMSPARPGSRSSSVRDRASAARPTRRSAAARSGSRRRPRRLPREAARLRRRRPRRQAPLRPAAVAARQAAAVAVAG